MKASLGGVPERTASLPFSFRIQLMRSKKVSSVVCLFVSLQPRSVVAFFIQRRRSETKQQRGDSRTSFTALTRRSLPSLSITVKFLSLCPQCELKPADGSEPTAETLRLLQIVSSKYFCSCLPFGLKSCFLLRETVTENTK